MENKGACGDGVGGGNQQHDTPSSFSFSSLSWGASDSGRGMCDGRKAAWAGKGNDQNLFRYFLLNEDNNRIYP